MSSSTYVFSCHVCARSGGMSICSLGVWERMLLTCVHGLKSISLFNVWCRFEEYHRTCPKSPMTVSLIGSKAALSVLRSSAWPRTVTLAGSSRSVISSGTWIPPLVSRSWRRLGLRTCWGGGAPVKAIASTPIRNRKMILSHLEAGSGGESRSGEGHGQIDLHTQHTGFTVRDFVNTIA